MPLKLTEKNGKHVVTRRDDAGRVIGNALHFATRGEALAHMRRVNTAERATPAPAAATTPSAVVIAKAVGETLARSGVQTALAEQARTSERAAVEKRTAEGVATSERLVRDGIRSREQRDALWRAQEDVVGSPAWMLREMAAGRSGRVGG